MRKCGYNWTHLYAGDPAHSKVVSDYRVSGYPSLWVVGKDGYIFKANAPHEQPPSIISAAIAEKTK